MVAMALAAAYFSFFAIRRARGGNTDRMLFIYMI